jgi:peptidoglycan/xylan/chitin deacetylase (PgdA/CDA1 family)
MNIRDQIRVMRTALRQRRRSLKWLAASFSVTLLLFATSLGVAPAAHAAGGMVSVTFDDGWASQYNNGLPILKKYGVPATLYVLSGSINTPDYMTQAQIQAFADRGDEIASHTVTHADLTKLSAAQLENELARSKATLQQMFGPSAALDFASPYGAYNATTTAAVRKHYASQRNTDVGFNAQAGFNPYNILVQNVDSSTSAATVQGWINSAKANNTWLVLVYHEVGASIGQDIYHTATDVLDAHMAAVKNSGLPMVTVRQGVDALASPNTPPPAVSPQPGAAAPAIDEVAAANPGLGSPSGNIVCGLVSGGCYRMYQRGAVIWSPASGAHYSVGGIRQAWASTDFERGPLGYPVTDEYSSGSGVAQDYQGGRITWTAGGGAVISYGSHP